MIFLFGPSDDDKFEEQLKELGNIVKIALPIHFDQSEIYRFSKNYAAYDGTKVYVEVDNQGYFNDIQKSIENMSKMEHKYMTDFVSDVQENLSFVPKIEVE